MIGLACDGVGQPRRAKCESCDVHTPRHADVVDRPGDSRRSSDRRPTSRYADLEAFLKKTPDERMAYWRAELSRCVKCYACRQVCPLCYCQQCIVDKNRPQCISTSATLKGNFAWHITRAFHLAGRCVGCDECTRACPAGIDLRLLEPVAGEGGRREVSPIRAGIDPDAEPLIGSYSEQDHEETSSDERNHLQSVVAAIGRTHGSAKAGAWPARIRSKAGHVFYRSLAAAGELLLDGFIRPPNSIKEFVFPRHEKLYGYRFEGKQIELIAVGAADDRADHHRRPALRRRRAADPRPRVQLGLHRTSSTTAAAS